MTDDTGASRLDGMTSLALPRTATSATTNPASTAPTAPSTATDPPPAPRRDQLIDLLRIASAGVVVTMHWLSTRVWVDGEHGLREAAVQLGPAQARDLADA